MSPAARRTLAGALAPLAVLAVLVSGVSAAVVYPGDDIPEADGGTTPTATPPGEDVLAPDGFRRYEGSGGTSALIPSTGGWETTQTYDVFVVKGDEGRVRLSSPAISDLAWCDDVPNATLAVLGFTTPPDLNTSAQDEAARVLDRWVTALRTSDGDDLAATEPTSSEVELDSGATAWTSASVIEASAEDGCDLQETEVRVVSAESEDRGAVTAVLLRALDAEGDELPEGVDAETADAILRSFQPG